jgi:hypothetical protein
MAGAVVYFTDFNEEVLRTVTWPNILVNTHLPVQAASRAKCFAGDWTVVSKRLAEMCVRCTLHFTLLGIIALSTQWEVYLFHIQSIPVAQTP